MFQRAERKAEELMVAEPAPSPTPGPGGGEPVRPPNARQLAWFYSFADPNTAKALDWANKAYSAEPNSPSGGPCWLML